MTGPCARAFAEKALFFVLAQEQTKETTELKIKNKKPLLQNGDSPLSNCQLTVLKPNSFISKNAETSHFARGAAAGQPTLHFIPVTQR